MNKLKFLFGMNQRVTRTQYMVWGFSLMAVKYLGEVALYYSAKGTFLTPQNFLSPLLSSRYPQFQLLPDWFVPAIVLWSLPFIWIGAGMSIRRAADAALSPWLGILFFVPGINYFLMFVLSVLESSKMSTWSYEQAPPATSRVMSPITLSVAFALAGTLVAWFSTTANPTKSLPQ